MTIHLAKGLNFNSFVLWLGWRFISSAMSLNTRSELEEERRLFYVITRVNIKHVDLCTVLIIVRENLWTASLHDLSKK
jgi:superfamily I DNA/RNA helicase